MCVIKTLVFFTLLYVNVGYEADANVMSMLDFRYLHCIMKRDNQCPSSEINFFLYTPEFPINQWIDMRTIRKLPYRGWKASRKNVFIIHGFNGTHSKTPMTFLRDAYLSRKDYNVFTVDWSPLSRFPCYLSALSNMRLAAQCTAQLYSYLTQYGAKAKGITCVGHSLGAHVCGMMSKHLTEKQYKIVGLDPARPLISEYGSSQFRLGRDDAYVVQVLHTNAGFLGETGLVGHADFCINGGRMQPGCTRQGPNLMRVARCSHFMSSCYFAASVRRRLKVVGVPCDTTCPKQGRWGLNFSRKPLLLGDEMPESSRGMYCVDMSDHVESCPFE